MAADEVSYSANGIEEHDHDHPTGALSIIKRIFKKLLCIFDDIPFVIKSGTSMAEADAGFWEALGSYMLAGVGAVVFALGIKDGIKANINANKLPDSSPFKWIRQLSSKVKIGLSTFGLVNSIILGVATYLGIAALVGAVASVMVPVVLAGLAGMKLVQHGYQFHKTKQLTGKPSAIIAAERKVTFSTVFFAISLAIVALAALTTLGALSVITVPMLPLSWALIGVVAGSAVLKFGQEVIDPWLQVYGRLRSLFRGVAPEVSAPRHDHNHKHHGSDCHKPKPQNHDKAGKYFVPLLTMDSDETATDTCRQLQGAPTPWSLNRTPLQTHNRFAKSVTGAAPTHGHDHAPPSAQRKVKVA